MTCTFFGHKDSPESLRPAIEKTVRDLIENHRADHFYVGHQGNFDRMALEVLYRLSASYPHIRYEMVLAYLPSSSSAHNFPSYADTLFPDGLESVPPRFAISYRNQWMIRHADYIVSGVTHSWGSAAHFILLAEKWNKTVIPLSC